MKILAIDSSAKSASCAVSDDERLLGEFFLDSGFTHSQTLMPMIDSLLGSLSLALCDIDAFAVNIGPGSFTGIRIGAATVKGLAFSENKPCVGVPTLESIAMNIYDFDGIVCPVMDARCRQVYNALFEMSHGRGRRLCADRAVGLRELENDLCERKKPVMLVGDGALLCYNDFGRKCGFEIAPDNIRLCHASSAARAAFYMLLDGRSVSPDELRPLYLRPSQAERERAARLKEAGAKEEQGRM